MIIPVFAGRTALVLGANGLIGNAISTRLAAAGAKVVLAARNAEALSELRDSLEAQDFICICVPTDVTDDAAVRRLIEHAAQPKGLDIAINNVASAHLPLPIGELDISEFDHVIAVTLRGVAIAMKHELAAMGTGATVVNIASGAGLDAAPGMSAYVAAKHAVIGLTKTAAIDYAGKGIRVNAVAPGPIESGPIMKLPQEVRTHVGAHVPLGRMGTPDEVAEAAFWLASPLSSFTTGAVLTVDGGKRA